MLLPLSYLFRLLARLRRIAYTAGLLRTYHSRIPIIVVGNICVGGSGKTPLVIWLADFLKKKGFSPGIISRGYGGTSRNFPKRVHADSDPARVGDEAVLMAQRAGCPVVIDPVRSRAARVLEQTCDILIADDGLQHYALGRTVEIAVIDGARPFGNGYCLPAGPLREPPSRLNSVDFIVVNGKLRDDIRLDKLIPLSLRIDEMALVDRGLVNLHDKTFTKSAKDFAEGPVHALAGIGNPGRFFAQLRSLGLQLIEHPFPDHHRFTREDLQFTDTRPVIMTEKDAVKCHAFAQAHHWYLPVEASLDENFGERLLSLLARNTHG